ncbi:MAG: metallophosphoesterase [Nanobdellota archaeon]
MEKKRFIIIILAFVIISLLINYLFINTIFLSLNLHKGVVFYLLLFFLSFSYPLTVSFERYRPMLVTRLFYMIASIWIGIAFFSVFVFLIYKFLNIFFKINPQLGSAVVLSFILVMAIVALLNGRKLKINLVDIEIKGLKKELKIVHLSDLHIGAIHRKKYLERVVEETNSLNPDVVVITGDLVDGSTVIKNGILSSINDIKSPVYFVVGNHDIYEGLDKILPILNKTKMKTLRDTKTQFKGINFIGIDYSDFKKEITKKLDKIDIDKNKVNILLYHAPMFKLKELEKKGIALQLAGHTHNGQIFPFNLFIKLMYKYPVGLYKSGDSNLFVSSGTGTWGPPMRLGSFSEIDLINLRKKK